MSRAKVFQSITDPLAHWVFLRWPKWVLNWQNQSFLASPMQQAWMVLLMCLSLCGLVPVIWRGLVAALALSVPSAQWMERQQQVQEAFRQSALQQTQAMNVQVASLERAIFRLGVKVPWTQMGTTIKRGSA